MRWYDISIIYIEEDGDLYVERDELAHKRPDDTNWCKSADVDRERRRLLVKLRRERACKCLLRQSNWESGDQVAEWCTTTADAIEAGEPLTYFEKLANTHDSAGKKKKKPERKAKR